MQKCGQRRMPYVDHFGDALYSGFVALATILHGACVFLYFADALYSGFVALATILHGACKVLNRRVSRKGAVSHCVPKGCRAAGCPERMSCRRVSQKGVVSQGVASQGVP